MAFYMVGDIEEVKRRAVQLIAEAEKKTPAQATTAKASDGKVVDIKTHFVESTPKAAELARAEHKKRLSLTFEWRDLKEEEKKARLAAVDAEWDQWKKDWESQVGSLSL
jgi:hypothetical protein